MSLKNLQTKLGLEADGVFGPTTLKTAAKFYNLIPTRAAHFFGQCSHETGGFKVFSENLNYSAAGLRNGSFAKYFPTDALALEYERKPEKIANLVYANRMMNGNPESGDGWKYRGRGAIQLTGKSNYMFFADWCQRPEILTNPDLVATELAFESAMFFFDRNKLWSITDQGVNDKTILELTKRINGGTNGLEDRAEKTKKYFVQLTT